MTLRYLLGIPKIAHESEYFACLFLNAICTDLLMICNNFILMLELYSFRVRMCSVPEEKEEGKEEIEKKRETEVHTGLTNDFFAYARSLSNVYHYSLGNPGKLNTDCIGAAIMAHRKMASKKK